MEAVHGKRIIIVEGAAGDAASAADCLRLGGHQVDVAPHLRVARDRLAAQLADLLLCDAGSMLAVRPSPKDRPAAWRAALAGLAYELRNLLDTLSESIDELCQLTSATPFVGRAEALVELHGGRVWVESHPGRGTTVFVSLPQPTTPQEEAWAGGYGAR